MIKKITFFAVLATVIAAGVASAHPGHPIHEGFALHDLGGLAALLIATTAALVGFEISMKRSGADRK
jgi:hypothetical protein